MEHGASWFSFLPGYQQIEHYLKYTQEQMNGAPGGFLFGHPVIGQHVVAGVLVTIVLLILSLRARQQLNAAGDDAVIPDPHPSIRNFFELTLEALYKQSKAIIGPEAPRYFPVIGTLALFILFSNVLGLVPGFLPPTDQWNTTMACGGFVFVYYNYHGFRTQGLGHLAHMANPAGVWWGWFLAPLLFPIELVTHIARPATLGIRLAANMIGDHAVLSAFIGLVAWLVPLPFLVLGLMVSVVQTLVFVMLTMIYIGLAVAHVEDDHGEPELREGLG